MQIALPRPAAGARIAAAAPPRTTVAVAAALSLGAAWVHLAYVGPHLRQWWAYGAFFLATGIGQAIFAPLCPHANVPERVGGFDLATAGAEVVLIGLLVTILRPRTRQIVANVLTA